VAAKPPRRPHKSPTQNRFTMRKAKGA
jgi:hypothetical protein